MQFAVLGPLVVTADGVERSVSARQQRAVLSRLLLAGGSVVPLDALADAVWGAAPPADARGALHALLAKLRRVLEPERAPRGESSLLVRMPAGYALRVPDGSVDAHRFDAAVTAAGQELDAGRPARALVVIDGALASWGGTPYAEFADEDWAAGEVARLTEVRLVAVERRFTAMLELGRAAEAVPELDAAVRADPLREDLWRLLALALYRAGRQADALAAARRARAHLAEELGVEPGPALRRLEGMLLAQDPGLLAGPHPGPPPGGSRPEAAASPEDLPALAGRADALAALLATSATSADRPACAVIRGEAGVGKTWLAGRLADAMRRQGWQVAWGRGAESGGRPALWPWLQVFAALGVRLEPPAGADAPDAAEARFRRHTELLRALGAACAAAPCLVVLDDVQWADDASLRLAADLLTMGPAGRLQLVLTLRAGEEVPDELGELLAALRAAGATRVDLAGLPREGVRAMAGAAGLTLDGAELDRLVARTGGNPLFVQETLRVAGVEGLDAALGAVPDGVADLVRRRLGRLPDPAVLTAAAVVGHAGDVRLLSAVTGAEPAAVLDAVDAAVAARLLAPDRAFPHDLVRQTVLDAVPAARRAALHQAAGTALAASPDADPEAVAAHFLAASPLAGRQAVQWARAAALAATWQLAPENAAAWWARAAAEHAAAGLPDLSERAELLLREVAARLDAGHVAAARRIRAQALRTADAAGDAGLQRRALVALDAPVPWQLKDYDEVELQLVRRLERALDEVPAGDSVLRCRLLATLATELYDSTADPRCDRLSAEAVAMARRLGGAPGGGPALLASALNARALAVARPSHRSDLEDVGQELTRHADAHDLPAWGVAARMLLCRLATERLDLAEADRLAAECDVQIRRLGLRLLGAQHAVWHGIRLALAGRFPAAHRACDEAGDRLVALGLFSVEHYAALVRWCLLVAEGRAASIDEADLARLAPMVPAVTRDLALAAAAARGDRARVADLAAAPWARTADDWTQLAFLALRALAVAAAGDRDEAARVHAELSPHRGRLAMGGNILVVGPVDLYLADVAALLGRREEAEALLQSCVAATRAAGLGWWADRAADRLRAVRGPLPS